MSGDVHVRICEGLGVKFPWATRLVIEDQPHTPPYLGTQCLDKNLEAVSFKFFKFLLTTPEKFSRFV